MNFLNRQTDTYTKIRTQKEHFSYLRFQSKRQLNATIQLLKSALWSVLKAANKKILKKEKRELFLFLGLAFRLYYTPRFIQVQFIIGNPGEEGYNNKP